MTTYAYRVIHIVGVLFVFASLGALMLASREGIERGNGRKLAGITHGIALLLVLVTGFGALARLGLSNPGVWPMWVWLKALIWLALGGVIVLIRRAPQLGTLLWWLLPLLGGAAAYLAIYKPG
ncbi:MAG TPA: hypothetical protein VGH73_04825 [Thermoanaerobaculia bacterium]|jgi:hypothetical protein